MKCIKKDCNKTVQHFVISKDAAINPQTCEIGNLRELFGYFQYKAPNTSSYQCTNLDSSYHANAYREMTKSWKNENFGIIPSNAPFGERSRQYALDGESICSYCKRFACKRKQSRNGTRETDFDCLVRHIRNSLAHGRVFVIHGGNSIKILFEDYDPRRKVITSRIVCNQSDLKKWRTIINQYLKIQRETNVTSNIN